MGKHFCRWYEASKVGQLQGAPPMAGPEMGPQRKEEMTHFRMGRAEGHMP